MKCGYVYCGGDGGSLWELCLYRVCVCVCVFVRL